MVELITDSRKSKPTQDFDLDLEEMFRHLPRPNKINHQLVSELKIGTKNKEKFEDREFHLIKQKEIIGIGELILRILDGTQNLNLLEQKSTGRVLRNIKKRIGCINNSLEFRSQSLELQVNEIGKIIALLSFQNFKTKQVIMENMIFALNFDQLSLEFFEIY